MGKSIPQNQLIANIIKGLGGQANTSHERNKKGILFGRQWCPAIFSRNRFYAAWIKCLHVVGLQ